MKAKVLGALMTFGLALSGVASADSLDDLGNVRFRLFNSSGYTIRELYLTRVGTRPWDVLGSGVLEPGYAETITTAPGRYSLRLVDGDGDDCEVSNVDIHTDRSVTVTRDALLRCEGF
jgi:hypothetical protein